MGRPGLGACPLPRLLDSRRGLWLWATWAGADTPPRTHAWAARSYCLAFFLSGVGVSPALGCPLGAPTRMAATMGSLTPGSGSPGWGKGLLPGDLTGQHLSLWPLSSPHLLQESPTCCRRKLRPQPCVPSILLATGALSLDTWLIVNTEQTQARPPSRVRARQRPSCPTKLPSWVVVGEWGKSYWPFSHLRGDRHTSSSREQEWPLPSANWELRESGPQKADGVSLPACSRSQRQAYDHAQGPGSAEGPAGCGVVGDG